MKYKANHGPDPDFRRSFKEIVNENGFIFEKYDVVTEDGYILSLFRIVANSTKIDDKNKPVAFLMHGILDSADCFIMNYPNVAPAFTLLRAGYDVWLGNQRGTKYSMGHTTLNYKTNKTYWEFSFTEMGQYDAPAMIDFVRNHTGQQKVTYIGHS